VHFGLFLLAFAMVCIFAFAPMRRAYVSLFTRLRNDLDFAFAGPVFLPGYAATVYCQVSQ